MDRTCYGTYRNGAIELEGEPPFADGARVRVILDEGSAASSPVPIPPRESAGPAPAAPTNAELAERRRLLGTDDVPSDEGPSIVPCAPGVEAEPGSLADRLRSVIGKARGLPPDLAAQHDYYLHGQPKR